MKEKSLGTVCSVQVYMSMNSTENNNLSFFGAILTCYFFILSQPKKKIINFGIMFRLLKIVISTNRLEGIENFIFYVSESFESLIGHYVRNEGCSTFQ